MNVLSRDEWGALSFLVADDTGVVRAMMEMTLLALGAGAVSMASDGEEAMQSLKENPVDIVISDLNMTPVSGLDFLRSLRAVEDSSLASTPVVVVSGYGEDEVKDQVMAAGGDAFMSKPVKPGGIEERIVAILESRGRGLASLPVAASQAIQPQAATA